MSQTKCRQCQALVPGEPERCPLCNAPLREGLFQRIARWLSTPGPPRRIESVTIKTHGIRMKDPETGEIRSYSSIEELPERFREQARELLEHARQNPQQPQILSESITITTPSGGTQTFHSVEEMPPGVRAIYEAAIKKRNR